MGEEFAFYTGKLSEVIRQLALIGFAVMWLFMRPVANSPTVPRTFRLPAAFLLLALVCDFLQYVWGAAGWAWFKEVVYGKPGEDDEQVLPPRKTLYLFPYAMLVLKAVFLMLGYVLLIYQLGVARTLFTLSPEPNMLTVATQSNADSATASSASVARACSVYER